MNAVPCRVSQGLNNFVSCRKHLLCVCSTTDSLTKMVVTTSPVSSYVFNCAAIEEAVPGRRAEGDPLFSLSQSPRCRESGVRGVRLSAFESAQRRLLSCVVCSSAKAGNSGRTGARGGNSYWGHQRASFSRVCVCMCVCGTQSSAVFQKKKEAAVTARAQPSTVLPGQHEPCPQNVPSMAPWAVPSKAHAGSGGQSYAPECRLAFCFPCWNSWVAMWRKSSSVIAKLLCMWVFMGAYQFWSRSLSPGIARTKLGDIRHAADDRRRTADLKTLEAEDLNFQVENAGFFKGLDRTYPESRGQCLYDCLFVLKLPNIRSFIRFVWNL